MSLSLVNKLYEGCLFIWRGENLLIHSVTYLNDEAKIVNALVVDYNGRVLALSCTYDEFIESVVK
jgi:hypothetical protein